MLNNEVTLNLYLLASVLGISLLVGYVIRTGIVMKCKSKIEELEREILSNYEYILELEKETSTMESKIQDITSPVIAMKAPVKEELRVSKKIPDISLRRELLLKKNMRQQSASGL
jgi:uncharacterized membrane protein YciS (DUF1049 family)